MPKTDQWDPLLHPPASKLCAVLIPTRLREDFEEPVQAFSNMLWHFGGQPSALDQSWVS